MSFSRDVKDELCKLELKKECCIKAELSAFIRSIGVINISGVHNMSIKFRTESAAIAQRLYKLLKNKYDITSPVMIYKNDCFQKSREYTIIINNTAVAKYILEDVGILYKNDANDLLLTYNIDKNGIKKVCCKKAYLRGAFLGVGSITNPEKNYHLELIASNELYAQDLVKLIKYFGIKAKYIERKGNYVVYLKRSDQIVCFLNIIDAVDSLLKIENIRVFKDVRNNVNRIVNCETANLAKTVETAYRQIKDIQYIEKTIGLTALPAPLRQLARLRIDYEDATLKELGLMLDPPLSKSGVNHRLKKMEKIAESLRAKEGVKDNDTGRS